MSALLLIAFVPVFFGGVTFVALLFAAATAGPRDAPERHPLEGTTAVEEGPSGVAPPDRSPARAA